MYSLSYNKDPAWVITVAEQNIPLADTHCVASPWLSILAAWLYFLPINRPPFTREVISLGPSIPIRKSCFSKIKQGICIWAQIILTLKSDYLFTCVFIFIYLRTFPLASWCLKYTQWTQELETIQVSHKDSRDPITWLLTPTFWVYISKE